MAMKPAKKKPAKRNAGVKKAKSRRTATKTDQAQADFQTQFASQMGNDLFGTSGIEMPDAALLEICNLQALMGKSSQKELSELDALNELLYPEVDENAIYNFLNLDIDRIIQSAVQIEAQGSATNHSTSSVDRAISIILESQQRLRFHRDELLKGMNIATFRKLCSALERQHKAKNIDNASSIPNLNDLLPADVTNRKHDIQTLINNHKTEHVAQQIVENTIATRTKVRFPRLPCPLIKAVQFAIDSTEPSNKILKDAFFESLVYTNHFPPTDIVLLSHAAINAFRIKNVKNLKSSTTHPQEESIDDLRAIMSEYWEKTDAVTTPTTVIWISEVFPIFWDRLRPEYREKTEKRRKGKAVTSAQNSASGKIGNENKVKDKWTTIVSAFVKYLNGDEMPVSMEMRNGILESFTEKAKTIDERIANNRADQKKQIQGVLSSLITNPERNLNEVRKLLHHDGVRAMTDDTIQECQKLLSEVGWLC